VAVLQDTGNGVAVRRIGTPGDKEENAIKRSP
jgi:hypothetical protein